MACSLIPALTPSGGSYTRRLFAGDVLYSLFRYKELNITFAKRSGAPTKVTDLLARAMVKEGLISQEAYDACIGQMAAAFPTAESLAAYDGFSQEALYGFLHSIRRQTLGVDALEAMNTLRARRGIPFDPTEGIDQRGKKAELLSSGRPVVFALFEASFLPLLLEDLQTAGYDRALLLVSPDRGHDLPDRALLSTWLEAAPVQYIEIGSDLPQDACILAYGEEGLLHCRKLPIPAFVHAVPKGYCAQALVNQLGDPRACAVYIPAGLDLVPCVPLTDRARLMYFQLYLLWKAYGEGIYTYTPEQLYTQYPQYFLNIYGKGAEAAADYPIRLPGCTPERFLAQREAALEAYLTGFEGLSYRCAYFDEALRPQPIATDSSQKQPGILVNAVRVPRAKNARVISCGGKLRKAMEAEGRGIVSNFLFFLTDKLGALYNDLRADRPYEQADAAQGHLDYMLSYQNGIRKETFPLFRKACFAKTRNGAFFFFHFRLGGGFVDIGTHRISWEASDVDPQTPGAVAVYTPSASLPYEDADRQTFSMAVGHGRLNLVILQDRLCAIRKGDVLLPSVGVVISLEEDHPFAKELTYLENGYYAVPDEPMTVRLEPPQGIDPQQWEQVEWAYGGGLTLIRDGQGLCDDTQTQERFRQEGWLCPLSRQTQESNLHSLVKHPRTALGLTKTGELVVLVYSGRTWRSTGADYREMISIARQLYPDICQLMNMDGGGSAVLGLVERGSFMELSFPSTSAGSCAGMARPVNTVLYIPIG